MTVSWQDFNPLLSFIFVVGTEPVFPASGRRSFSAHLVPWNSCGCECTSQHGGQANILKLRGSGICNETEVGRIINDPYS